jgi:HlyD family secretion protein
MSIPQVNASIISNQNQQNTLQKETMDMDNQITRQRALFIQSLNSYKNIVEDWKQKYLLIAPIKSKLAYATFLEENQQLWANQIIGFVTNETNKYYVEMLIPQTNFGKVKPGQEVLLKFPSYPAQEFGSAKGRIEYIKTLPVDSGYLAKVSLPNGLVTNYKKTILFTEGLVAQAEIITEKRRLSDRFLSGLNNLLK